MELSTLTQIKTRLKNDCDIYDEDFMDLDTELLGLINSAIDDAEALIHSLYEDYFLVRDSISLVSGTQTYALPSDIYANKIRALVYNDGSKKYPLQRIQRFIEGEEAVSGEDYRFLLTNTSSSGVRLMLFPTPAETNSNLKIYYIRNAKKLSSESDSCDIPEFINFIYAHVKWNVARKEKSQIDITLAAEELSAQRQLMVDTLTVMVPDESNQVVKDLSFYFDFDYSNLDMRY